MKGDFGEIGDIECNIFLHFVQLGKLVNKLEQETEMGLRQNLLDSITKLNWYHIWKNCIITSH